MPVYRYACRECPRVLEKLVPFHNRDEQDCENCGFPLERLPSAPAVHVAAADRADAFTADMLGVPEKELPKGLKSKP